MKYTFLLGFLFYFIPIHAQTVKRQSIGSIGSSSYSKNMIVHQSIGQVYQTNMIKSENLEVIQGFIQPVNYHLSKVQSQVIPNISVSVFPNPASNLIAFNTDDVLENVSVTLYDQTGRVVFYELINNLSSYNFNCQSLPNGMYIIDLKADSVEIKKIKLIVTK